MASGRDQLERAQAALLKKMMMIIDDDDDDDWIRYRMVHKKE
jgi:hypothetical protein